MLKLFGFRKALSQTSSYGAISSNNNTENEIEKSGYFDCLRSYKNRDDLENQGLAQENGCLTPFYKCIEFFFDSKINGQHEVSLSPTFKSLMCDIDSFLTNQINTDNKEKGIQECKWYLEASDTLIEYNIQLNLLALRKFENDAKNGILDKRSPTLLVLDQTNQDAGESFQNVMQEKLQELVNLDLLKNSCFDLNRQGRRALVKLLVSKLKAFP